MSISTHARRPYSARFLHDLNRFDFCFLLELFRNHSEDISKAVKIRRTGIFSREIETHMENIAVHTRISVWSIQKTPIEVVIQSPVHSTVPLVAVLTGDTFIVI